MENFTNEAKNEVRRLLTDGKRITAVAYLCNTFNITSEQAEQLVQIVERENKNQPAFETTESVEPLVPPAPANHLTDRLRSEIIQRIQEGKKIEAVKLVKSELKLSLKDSAIIVDDLHREIDPNYQPIKLEKGCVGIGFKVVAFIFLALAFFSLAVTTIVYFIQEDTVKNGEKVTGVVTGFNQSDTGGAAPVVEYTWRGEKRVYNSTLFSTPPSFAMNEKVDLYINKEKPDDILIDAFSERWLVITVFGSIAGFFGIFFLIFLFVSRKF